MKKDKAYYLNLPYEIIIKPLSEEDGGGYFARYKDFKGIMGDGESYKEAIEDVKKAFELFIETSLADGTFIKEPISEDVSVRVNITMPKNLLEKIDVRARDLHFNRSSYLANLAQMDMAN